MRTKKQDSECKWRRENELSYEGDGIYKNSPGVLKVKS